LRQFGTFSRCGCDGYGESDCHIATGDHASASRVNKPSPRLRLSGIAAVDGSLNSAATLQRSSLIRRYVEWTVREIKTCRQSASPRSPKVLLAWHSPRRDFRSMSARSEPGGLLRAGSNRSSRSTAALRQIVGTLGIRTGAVWAPVYSIDLCCVAPVVRSLLPIAGLMSISVTPSPACRTGRHYRAGPPASPLR
jgi:hypothetical protein